MSTESIRVLLVEDNLGEARLLYEGLEEALPGQFQMTHVRFLSEALEYLWKESCDVILLDLGLPDSHGIDTLVLTRAQAPDVPIVVLTGFQDDATGDQALKEGAQDYLVKGQVDSKLLARSMRYAIERKEVAEALLGQGVALAKAGALRRSRQRLIEAHECVRRDIATRLHDDVQERIVVLNGLLLELVKGTNFTSETSRLLNAIRGLNQKIEEEVGDLRSHLYPPAFSEGLVPAFQSFRDRFGTHLDIEIEQDDELAKQKWDDHSSLSDQVGLAAYRIAEEALTNVVKNAKARKVTVRLDSSQEGCLRLTVRDDGQGLNAENSPHGLTMGSMQDYAEAVDGECSVHSDPGVGTEVAAVLPLMRPGDKHLEVSAKGAN